jgi:hypothetical protein
MGRNVETQTNNKQRVDMKRVNISLAAGFALLLVSIATANAWHKVGVVMCDANNSGTINAGDLPVQGVLVVVTNLSGTYSNASWTGNDGSFYIQLQDIPDSYMDYIRPDTLPVGTTHVLPPVASFTTTDAIRVITNNFLIQNPACSAPGKCWLTGGGTIDDGSGQPIYSFGGVVNPGCSAISAGGGNWNVIWHAAGLHFKGLEIQVLTCGNAPGYPAGSSSPKTPFNYIDFTGVGTLTGIEGNNANFGVVYFNARALDLKDGGKQTDQLYLRVYNSSGTLLLISGDQANPADVSPVTISTGNLQLHISSCSK